MKNLSNCKPSEFLAQTVKIRKSVAKWLDLTKILDIRKNLPTLNDGMTKEERNKALFDQVSKNIGNMFDSIFETHANETLELLALLCFVEPEKVDDYEIGDYLQSVSELISDDRVLSFFYSLVRLEKKNI